MANIVKKAADAACRSLARQLSPAGAQGRVTILTFHNVLTEPTVTAPGVLNKIEFAKIMDVVADVGHVMTLSDAAKGVQNGQLPERAVVITFDDGYVEWLDSICPLLLDRRLPATLFLSTGHIEGRSHWHDQIADAVHAMPPYVESLPFGLQRNVKLPALEDRLRLIDSLQERLKYLPLKDRSLAIQGLEALASGPVVRAPVLDRAAIRKMSDMGYEIGAHTRLHPILTRCESDEAWEEINHPKAELEAITGRPVTAFAYPNGRPVLDYTQEHIDMVRRAGYQCAVTTARGAARVDDDLFQLPRFSPWTGKSSKLLRQLLQNLWVPKKTYSLPKPGGRCLIVASTFPPIRGGSAVVYGNLCAKLPADSAVALTANREFATGLEIPAWRQHDANCGFRVERIPYIRPPIQPPPPHLLAGAVRLLTTDLPIFVQVVVKSIALMRECKLDTVCIGEVITGGWVGVALKRLTRCRLVVYVHGEEITTTYSGRLNLLGRASVLQSADRIVAVSEFARTALMEKLKVPFERVTVIENGIDTTRFSPGPVREDLITKHGLEGKRVLLSVGRLIPRKGIDMALRAMHRLAYALPDVHYLIIGEGPERRLIEDLIAELNLQSRVTLVGDAIQEDLVDYFRLCDVFLLPNRTMPDGDTEGFGLVFREANACKKPAIGGRAGGVVEAILEQYNGLLVDGTKPEDIAEKILRLFTDPGLSRRLAENGYLLAQRTNMERASARFLSACVSLPEAGKH